MRIVREMIGVAAILLLSGALSTMLSQTAATKTYSPSSPTPPQAYCTSTGGVVETRIPAYGTNGSIQDWLRLAGKQDFCQYTSSYGSRIHLSLDTLYALKPSLAALAYYAETPWNGLGEGNPASLYCTQLGGSDLFGGVNAAGPAPWWARAGGRGPSWSWCPRLGGVISR